MTFEKSLLFVKVAAINRPSNSLSGICNIVMCCGTKISKTPAFRPVLKLTLRTNKALNFKRVDKSQISKRKEIHKADIWSVSPASLHTTKDQHSKHLLCNHFMRWKLTFINSFDVKVSYNEVSTTERRVHIGWILFLKIKRVHFASLKD